MRTIVALLFSLVAIAGQAQNTITVSGRVTDFEGHPVDSCRVVLVHADFSEAYAAYSDEDGHYSIPNVECGRYAALHAIRPKEYPQPPRVSEPDMRLEYWAWNIIADRDIVINPRYHRLELYGTTVFAQHGGYPAMMIYTRPMSLGRYLDAATAAGMATDTTTGAVPDAAQPDVSVMPENIEFKVWADDHPLAVRSVQPVDEWIGGGPQKAYLIYVDRPKIRLGKHHVFRIAALNRADGGEWGENVYFYEIPEYK